MYAELIGVVVPIVLGVAMVLVTVVLVFWVGSGKKRSYEEAKAQASRKAEEVLRQKEQVSPKAKKARKNFRKKKEPQDEAETAPPRKGILKTNSPAASVEITTPERPSPNKVEFKLDAPVKEDGGHHTNPPTPYPNKGATLGAVRPVAEAVKTPQPIFEEAEGEEDLEPLKPSAPKKSEPISKKKQGTVDRPPQKTPQPAQKLPQKPPPAAQDAQKPPQAPVGKPEPAERVVMPKEAEIKRKPLGASAPKRPKGNKSKLVIGTGESVLICGL